MQTPDKECARNGFGNLRPLLVEEGWGGGVKCRSHFVHISDGTIRMAVIGLSLALMAGCAEWNSAPAIVEQNFGHAVNNMIKNQTLYPGHGQNDNPTLQMDGKKAESVIRAYREGSSEKPEQSKEGVRFDVKNIGSGSN